MRWVGHASHTGKRRGAHRVLMGKPEGKKPFGKVWCQWENNFEMDLQEVRWVWTELIWLRIGTGGGLF
jgi:hypothetical protein